MTAISHEVVSMYEDAGLTLEQIAEDTGFDIASIKANLLQFSKVYRDVQKNNAPDKVAVADRITDNELDEMLEVVKSIARCSEHDNTRLKAACRIIDEKENRLSAIKEVRSSNYNLILFNQQLLANRRAKEKVVEIIDIKNACVSGV